MKKTALLGALSIISLVGSSLRAEHWWERAEHWLKGEESKAKGDIHRPFENRPGYTARPKSSVIPAPERHAKRIGHWEKTVKALRAYGVAADDEIMKWAEKNLARAHHPRFSHWGRKARHRGFKRAHSAKTYPRATTRKSRAYKPAERKATKTAKATKK